MDICSDKRTLASWFYDILAVSCLLNVTIQAQVGNQDAPKPIVIATTGDEIDDEERTRQ